MVILIHLKNPLVVKPSVFTAILLLTGRGKNGGCNSLYPSNVYQNILIHKMNIPTLQSVFYLITVPGFLYYY